MRNVPVHDETWETEWIEFLVEMVARDASRSPGNTAGAESAILEAAAIDNQVNEP